MNFLERIGMFLLISVGTFSFIVLLLVVSLAVSLIMKGTSFADIMGTVVMISLAVGAITTYCVTART